MEIPSKGAAPDVGARLPASHVTDSEAEGMLALRASICAHCEKPVFPAADICPFCLSTENNLLPLSGGAKLYSFTTVHTGPSIWQTPYSIGYADFPNGVRILAKLAGSKESKDSWVLDQPVRLAVVKAEPEEQGEAPTYRYFLEEA